MKKVLKITVLVLAIVFVIAQFIRPDRTLPPEVQAETLEASTQVPPEVGAIFSRSCADCHSNRTDYPWYSQISPASWFMQNHINEGRRELNVSVWNTYAVNKKVRKLDKMCEEVQDGEMPLPSYLWIHWGAGMQPDEVDKLCAWTEAEKARLQAESQ